MGDIVVVGSDERRGGSSNPKNTYWAEISGSRIEKTGPELEGCLGGYLLSEAEILHGEIRQSVLPTVRKIRSSGSLGKLNSRSK